MKQIINILFAALIFLLPLSCSTKNKAVTETKQPYIIQKDNGHVLHFDRRPEEPLSLSRELVSEGMAAYLTTRIIERCIDLGMSLEEICSLDSKTVIGISKYFD